jgi:site-specific DNA-methyltransferase (adenine-specific)
MNKNKIYNDDCLRGMASMHDNTCDMILTDPPYLVNYTDRSGRSVANDKSSDSAWLLPAFSEMFRVLKNNSYAVVFYGWNEIDKFAYSWKKAGFRIVGNFTFTKRYASNAKSDKKHMEFYHECACLLAKGYPKPQQIISSVQNWSYTGNKLHPTQKSTKVLMPLIEAFCPAGGLVLDPFMGSGSTASSCIKSGREFIGFELDNNYYQLANQRIKAMLQAVQVQKVQQPYNANAGYQQQVIIQQEQKPVGIEQEMDAFYNPDYQKMNFRDNQARVYQ